MDWESALNSDFLTTGYFLSRILYLNPQSLVTQRMESGPRSSEGIRLSVSGAVPGI
jgi:hypothetical protein